MADENKPYYQPPPSWSSIPLDLAGLVLRLLPAYADRARFAAVCPQWRAAAKQQFQPPPLPLLALPDGTFYSLPYSKPFRFPGCGFAGYQSACGNWLVFPRDDLMCLPNLVAALVGIGHTSQILMCQPGALSWSVRAYDECKGLEDMVFYKGKLYAIATDQNLFVVNISEDHNTGDPQISKIGHVIKGDPVPWYSAVFDDNIMHFQKIYLVESRGALLMVRRAIWCQGVDRKVMAGQNEFEVFEANFEHSRWDKVTTVGDDQQLFLGRRCSRAVSVSQYDYPGDNIMFLDDDEENYVQYAYQDESTSFSAYGLRLGFVSSALSKISWKRGDEMRMAVWLFPEDL